MKPIRTLILSGGGGRGAFHAGVYKYLSQTSKPHVDEDHQDGWLPDIVVGTSIGAVNGAAIVQGMSGLELEQVWRGLRERDIQGLPPGMRGAARWMTNLFLRQAIGVRLPRVPLDQSTSPPPEQSWTPVSFRPNWLSERLVGRWSNLLDTGPLRNTLENTLKLDPDAIQASPQQLLITATNVRTGERVTFSNHPIISRSTGKPRSDVIQGITFQRILASCSIPLVYPWTTDPETLDVYWDGAVVANTPLSGALDAASSYPLEVPMEAVVVLMTPWRDQEQVRQGDSTRHNLPLPGSINEAITYTLDWALLASFRERLRVTEAYNLLARMERDYYQARGETWVPHYREVKVVVVAPEDFFPAARIIDYDERTNQLINLGYQAAARAFRVHFPAGSGSS